MSDNARSSSSFSVEVGRRLRAVRRARRLSLDEVERSSGGRWSASAIGAYERGFRNLSLPRLQELAGFYNLPMSMLIGEDGPGEESPGQGKLVLDVQVLDEVPDAAAIAGHLRTIVVQRAESSRRVVSVRRDDVRALCGLLHVGEPELFELLRSWGALVGATTATFSSATEAARPA
ncbi:helix-turn-helix domain-containing protein [soil metagenome]